MRVISPVIAGRPKLPATSTLALILREPATSESGDERNDGVGTSAVTPNQADCRGTTLLGAAGLPQKAAHASMSLRRLSKRSPRR
jgi:hypothetical protein